MDTIRFILMFIGGIVLGALICSLFKDVLPEDGVAPLFIAMIIFIVSITLVFVVGEKLHEKSIEVTENIKEMIEEKREEKELNEIIKNDAKIYQESKHSFQFFSNETLFSIYNEYLNGSKKSNFEQLALEEELVKRNLISHSPMHEKLYALNKDLFRS